MPCVCSQCKSTIAIALYWFKNSIPDSKWKTCIGPKTILHYHKEATSDLISYHLLGFHQLVSIIIGQRLSLYDRTQQIKTGHHLASIKMEALIKQCHTPSDNYERQNACSVFSLILYFIVNDLNCNYYKPKL